MGATANFGPIAATTAKPINLAMQRLWLTGQVLPAGARLVVQHVFRSEEENPLEVVYSFPLPRDAALRQFRITGEGFEAHSELKATEAAVKAYEEGIERGSLSALVRQYGDGLINLTVGNIRPKETVTVHLEILCGVELNDQGFRFRFPFTLAPGYHSRAKAALTADGEGEIELPADQFGDMLLPRFREDASALHQVGFDLSLVGGLGFDEIGSPSHVVKVRQQAGGSSASVTLNAERDVPNRDLVLDAHFKSVAPQVLAGRRQDGNGHFAAIVPSSAFGSVIDAPRRVVILLDRSGSMQGDPLEQSRKAIAACLGALSESDSFGLAAFSTNTVMFRPTLVSGTRDMRNEAQKFLTQVEAGGGTELAAGFLQASALLDGKGGDVLILTDGQVSGTEQILALARTAGVRLHCLGIGSASQDRFLSLLARETGGVSRFVSARERVDLSAVDLFASIGRPIASGLTAGANIQPAPTGMVFSGTPVLLFGEETQEDGNQIQLNWDGGSLNLPVSFNDGTLGETVYLMQGARLITDWESRYPATEALAPLQKRTESRIAARLLALSKRYGLASREMSLVSVVKRKGDRPGELPETRVVPLGMPQDTKFGAYFSAPGKFMSVMATSFDGAGAPCTISAAPPRPPAIRPGSPKPSSGSGVFSRIFGARNRASMASPQAPPAAPNASPAFPVQQADDQVLLDLATRMDADGGMPGQNVEQRAIATSIALLAFLSQGHTPARGAFRSHVAKLVSFLKSLSGLTADQQQTVEGIIDIASKGLSLPGDWIKLAQASPKNWSDLEKAVTA